MNILLLNIMLSLAWVGMTGQFTPENVIVGFVIGFGMLWLARRPLNAEAYFQKFPQVISFLWFFFVELVKSNVKMAYNVVVPDFKQKMRPGVVAVPLDATSDSEITLLANLITLTPGTLSLDVSADRKTLFVHTIWVDDADAFRAEIKNGFERRVIEVLR